MPFRWLTILPALFLCFCTGLGIPKDSVRDVLEVIEGAAV